MAVERVDGWKTSDGMVFGKQVDAESHDAYLRLKQFVLDGDLTVDCSYEDAVTCLWRHRDVLQDILSRATPPTDNEVLSRG